MRSSLRCVGLVAAVGVVFGLPGETRLHAQTPALTHLGHVLEGFRGTPEGQGLLPTAFAEAEVVVTHAGLMVRDLSNLDAMQTHAGHVLHAIDPEELAAGPGLGYGLKHAAAGVLQHVRLSARSEGATPLIETHSAHAVASATNTVDRAERILELAKGIRAVESAYAAGVLAQELNELAAVLIVGLDANDDGTVGWQEGEGGLDVVRTHVGLMAGG